MKLKKIIAFLAFILSTQLMQANYNWQIYSGRTVTHEGSGYKPGANETSPQANTYPAYPTEQPTAYPKYKSGTTNLSTQEVDSRYNNNYRYRHGGVITNPKTGTIINQ